MPRGRPKQGYGNRTDLNGKIPKSAPTGMPYGENKKLMDAQSAVPMANPEMEKVAPQEQTVESPMQSAPPMPSKVTPVPLTAPTERPNENILTGTTTTRQPDRDLQKLKSLQPLFEAEAALDDSPRVFQEFVSWLKTQ